MCNFIVSVTKLLNRSSKSYKLLTNFTKQTVSCLPPPEEMGHIWTNNPYWYGVCCYEQLWNLPKSSRLDRYMYAEARIPHTGHYAPPYPAHQLAFLWLMVYNA